MTSFHDRIPEKYKNGALNAAQALKKLDKTLIAAHINPDGDAVGAMAAVGHIMKKLGRDFAIYAPGNIPRYLDFVPLPGPVYKSLAEIPFKPESAVFVDCSDKIRLGEELAAFENELASVNIDHHLCDKGLGSVANFIDPGAAATCQLMAYVCAALGMKMDNGLGEAIGVGMLTDTGHFRHGNTNREVFRLCSDLEDDGASLAHIADELHNVWTLHRLHIWGKSYLRIHIAGHGKIAWCLLTKEEIRHDGIGKDDMEGFVDVLRNIVGVEIGVFGREIDNATRFSLRSKGDTNVREIAASFGGGGHRNAAGLTLEENGSTAMDMVLEACGRYLEEHG